ncbi:MAG: CBS domain-containing protein [Desulfobulbaceae bacterium]|nr:CBS domain-containing protein [Desulfobulbaceae bacterium]
MNKYEKNTLSGILVSRAMRRQINCVSTQTSISNAINILIKFKVSGLLAVDSHGRSIGVLSKTDVMGAYYAGLPKESSVEDVMSCPPLLCSTDAPLEKALQQMCDSGVYRLYVVDASMCNGAGVPEDGAIAVGALAYPDIVGILYKHCFECEHSHFRQQKDVADDSVNRQLVADVMTAGVEGVCVDDSLSHVMEQLSMYRFGAILVRDLVDRPVGVISKTDLVLAYKHGVDPAERAEKVMSQPVKHCLEGDLLEEAIRKMIFSDVHRLFVKGKNEEIVGVFSLTDAARNRSGSCNACISSRIKMEV